MFILLQEVPMKSYSEICGRKLTQERNKQFYTLKCIRRLKISDV